MSARAHRGLSGLMALAFGAQVLAAFVPQAGEACICTDATCCRPAKAARPPARQSCHSEQEPPASLRCGHLPDETVPLPASIALLPAGVAVVPPWHVVPVAAEPPSSPRPGFDRLDGPPPRPSLAS